jgi:N-acetylglutamate synthase-like GNAT family acetyltransferase
MLSDSHAIGAVTIRTELRPGDIGMVVHMHGILYGQESGFDPTFEAYVAGPLAEFVYRASSRECLWIAERDGRTIGCIAIVAASEEVAQLRWYLVDPGARGIGLGKRLLNEAISFSRKHGYRSVILWTVSSLTAAANLYSAAGFRKVEEKPRNMWGVDVVEEKYELQLV